MPVRRSEACGIALLCVAIAVPSLAFLCVTGPFVYGGERAMEAYRNRARKKYKLRRRQPRLLPRKRSLTIPDFAAEPTMEFNNQDQCMLLKLPWELRLEIYEQVLGGNRIHISPRADKGFQVNRVRSHFCKLEDPEGEDEDHMWRLHHPCYAKNLPKRSRPKLDETHLLALLQTCRRIYTDAVQFLYTTNIFNPTNMPCLFQLETRLLPQRLNMIRSLETRMELSEMFTVKHGGPYTNMDDIEYHPEVMNEFVEAWQLIGSMQGLQDVRVVITVRPYVLEWWQAIEPVFSETIGGIAGLRRFEVYFSKPQLEPAFEPVDWGFCKVYGKEEMESELY